ncbi:hypothetical protein HRbin11_02024 [bacterium HR11]|nr:hypothetical protein HRbin11_02024 [bacterium HR11]
MRHLRRYAWRFIGLAVLGWVGGCLVPAYAQVDEESFQQLEFNFIPPGARATAMGGAFIGLADDATAAQTNPAGLLVLIRPEIAAEGKFLNYDIPRLANRNSLFDFESTTFGANVGSPAFVSIVFPGKNKRWTVALFRHEFIRLKDEFTFDARTIVPGFLFFPVEGSMKFTGEQYGLALAVRLGRVDIGVAGKFARMKAESLIRRDFCDPIEFDLCGAPFVANVESLNDTDTGFGFTVGLMWRPSSRFQVGLVGEINPTFQWEDDTLYAELPGGTQVPIGSIEPRLGIPHRFGGGFAFRPTDQLVLTADVVWLQYSRIVDDNAELLYFYPGGDRALAIENFHISDRVEVRGGAEYVFFVGSTTVALRAGGFVFPERRIHYTKPANLSSPADAFWADTFDRLYNGLEDKTRVGVSGGLGFVVRNRLQVDVAYSWSKPVKQFSGSFVLRF